MKYVWLFSNLAILSIVGIWYSVERNYLMALKLTWAFYILMAISVILLERKQRSNKS